MILGALVLRPLPPEVASQVVEFARELSVGDDMLQVAREFAEGQVGMAAVDFDRNGYAAKWSPERAEALRASGLEQAWQAATDDPALGNLGGARAPDEGTLGRRMWQFYRAAASSSPAIPARHLRCWPSTTGCTWWRTTAPRSSPSSRCSRSSHGANDDPAGFSRSPWW